MKSIQQSRAEIWTGKSALQHLNQRSTVEEVDKAFREAGLFDSYHYVKDEHFEFALREINSLQKALKFVTELNNDRIEYELNYQRRWKNPNIHIDELLTCQKTWGIMSWLSDKQWHKSDYLVIPFAVARRTHCSCHNVGDFSKRKL